MPRSANGFVWHNAFPAPLICPKMGTGIWRNEERANTSHSSFQTHGSMQQKEREALQMMHSLLARWRRVPYMLSSLIWTLGILLIGDWIAAPYIQSDFRLRHAFIWIAASAVSFPHQLIYKRQSLGDLLVHARYHGSSGRFRDMVILRPFRRRRRPGFPSPACWGICRGWRVCIVPQKVSQRITFPPALGLSQEGSTNRWNTAPSPAGALRRRRRLAILIIPESQESQFRQPHPGEERCHYRPKSEIRPPLRIGCGVERVSVEYAVRPVLLFSAGSQRQDATSPS